MPGCRFLSDKDSKYKPYFNPILQNEKIEARKGLKGASFT